MNEGLAEIKSKLACELCAHAKAGCVTENGKSAKQADLCCKSDKESEAKDE